MSDILRSVVVVVAALLLVPLVMMVVFMPLGIAAALAWHGGTFHAAGAVLMWLILVVALVAVGYGLYGWLSEERSSDDAVEELRKAYARGDLSEEEFERRREMLGRE